MSLVLQTVSWTDPDAVVLRAAMAAEIVPRYADRQETFPVPPIMATSVDEVVTFSSARTPADTA